MKIVPLWIVAFSRYNTFNRSVLYDSVQTIVAKYELGISKNGGIVALCCCVVVDCVLCISFIDPIIASSPSHLLIYGLSIY